MTLYNSVAVNFNANINYDQPGIPSGMARSPGTRFLVNVGSLMIRCIPLFIVSLFTSTPPGGNTTWRHK